MSKAECRKRWKARRAERDEALLSGLRAHGASCRNCASYAGNHIRGRCDLKTDFYGICTVDAGDLCLKWWTKKRIVTAKPEITE